MTTYYHEYPKILVSVDCIIFGFDKGELRVLIGKRKFEPGRGQWSLYAGFVRNDECIDDTAKRTVYELTGLRNLYMQQVGAFGQVDRDPGERVISIVYYALINVDEYDDKLQEQHHVKWVNIDELPEMYSDHKAMIQRAREMMKEKISTEPISFKLLPSLFTLTQLQQLYEAVNGEEVDKRNFRKRIKNMDFIEKTELIDKTGSKRGAFLYRFNKKIYKADPSFKL